MGKKSGTAGSPVTPNAPTVAEDADLADPGKMTKIKEEQVEEKKGKYGAEETTPHKAEDDQDETKSWIEIELVGEDDKPIPGEPYKITLPDNTVAQGTLDEKGFARVEGFEKGTCKVCFPALDAEAWEKI